MMSDLTETEIVEAVRRGRHEGQTAMVGRYAQRVFAMIARQVPDTLDAEELTQDTFLRAFDHIDSYDAHKALRDKCDALLLSLNPERQKEARTAKEMADLKGELAEMKQMLSAFLGAKTKEKAED